MIKKGQHCVVLFLYFLMYLFLILTGDTCLALYNFFKGDNEIDRGCLLLLT